MIIICVRDPDASNEYLVFAEGQPEPYIVDVDLGRSDLGSREEFNEWRESQATEVAALIKKGTPNAMAAATALTDIIRETAKNYGWA